jgi:hypothetical protein
MTEKQPHRKVRISKDTKRRERLKGEARLARPHRGKRVAVGTSPTRWSPRSVLPSTGLHPAVDRRLDDATPWPSETVPDQIEFNDPDGNPVVVADTHWNWCRHDISGSYWASF